MGKITKEQVEHVAELSKLHFDDDKIDNFTETLGKIVEMVEQMNEVDTTDVPFMINVVNNLNQMREDISTAGWNRDELLKSVPESEDGFIKVPAIIDEGEDM